MKKEETKFMTSPKNQTLLLSPCQPAKGRWATPVSSKGWDIFFISNVYANKLCSLENRNVSVLAAPAAGVTNTGIFKGVAGVT